MRRALAETTGIVTDVGSVKGPICAAITDPRFVGGHPMAGSEREGLDGADPNLFEGAIWVLTPDDDADDLVFSQLTAIISGLGAEVVAIAPGRHDDVVAVVSHVPHLTAASLMTLADDRSIEHAALLRLAAGGFRDMTRVASGRPDIWLDICDENRVAIVGALGHLIDELGDVRDAIDTGRRDDLRDRLDRAREARANLPSRVVHPESLAEVRIPIPDRAGAAAEVFVLAADLSVNIANFGVVHAAETQPGCRDRPRRPGPRRRVPRRPHRSRLPTVGAGADMTDICTVRLAEGPVIAEVAVPPSKSIANRALVCAALASGESEIVGLAPGDDTNAMVDCLNALGVPVGISTDEPSVAVVVGTGGALPVGPITLDTRLAGTTSRFVTALASLGPGPYLIDGAPPLRARPMGPLHDSLHALGARLEPGEEWGHLPVTVSGPVGGADAIVMPGDVSSQYVTALMLIAPLIRDGLSLGLSTDLVSRPYVEITKAVMESFGAVDVHIAHRHVTVAESGYQATAVRGRARCVVGELSTRCRGDRGWRRERQRARARLPAG